VIIYKVDNLFNYSMMTSILFADKGNIRWSHGQTFGGHMVRHLVVTWSDIQCHLYWSCGIYWISNIECQISTTDFDFEI